VLELLLELTRQLLSEPVLPNALQHVSDAALELLPGDHASIRVLDRSRTELLSGARSGSGQGKKPVRHTPGEGIAGWVAEHGELTRVDDTETDERFVLKPNQGFRIRSMLAVPLWSAGEVVGVLAATASEPHAFAEEHEMLASLLANCAVPPIEKARLARLALTDAHTMAFNRGYLLPGIESEMARTKDGPGGPLSLLLLDLDHFKRVNDSYGHAAGDVALRSFADAIRNSTRDADVVVRRGGDEFVLIMPGTDRISALAVAERIRTTVSSSAVELDDGATVSLSVSIGGATWNGGETANELERRADQAMYEAKQAGRDCVRYADTGDTRATRTD
jgi:diguanylate cyclase (GGDEF)-like protein